MRRRLRFPAFSVPVNDRQPSTILPSSFTVPPSPAHDAQRAATAVPLRLALKRFGATPSQAPSSATMPPISRTAAPATGSPVMR